MALKPMRVVELRAENFKRLVAIDIRPEGDLVSIAGRNGQGKTSALDAIWAALGNQRNAKPAVAIRKGEEEARVQVDLGEMVVTRTYRKGKDGEETMSLKVIAADGTMVRQPQQVLDAIIGTLTFDPIAFLSMEPKKQFDAMRSFVPGFDFDAFTAAQRGDFEARRELNRKADMHQKAADAIRLPPGPCPALVDITEVTRELRAANEKNRAIEGERHRRDVEVRSMQNLLADIEVARERLAKMEAEYEERALDLELAEALDPPVDTAAIEQKIADASQLNEARGLHHQRQVAEHAAKAAKDMADALTATMEAREKARQDAIAAAKLPVPGLSFGDGEVLLDGLPIEQASHAQQLRTAIAVAAAMNPGLRVVCVRDGSKLDSDAMRALAEFASEHDLQVWIERVGDAGEVGFVIEDGRLRG